MKIDVYAKEKNLTGVDLTLFWLDSFEFLTINKKHKLLNLMLEEKNFNFEKNREKIIKIVGENNFNFMRDRKTNDYLNTVFEKVHKFCDFVVLTNENYPMELRNIYEAPLVLYYKGDISLLKNKNIIAVTGSRSYDNYGFVVTQSFVKTLIDASMTIVCGVNEGIESIIIKTAIQKKGKIIVVLNGGFNVIYPSISASLVNYVSKSGLVLSEQSPLVQNSKFGITTKNRIITGVANSLLITQAGKNSGTKYAVNYALEQNKNIYAICGNITTEKSAYCNELIKECQSMLVLSPLDILEDLHIPYNQEQTGEITEVEQAVLNCIAENSNSAHFDYILEKIGLDKKELLVVLSTLEINGKIKRMTGNFFVKI